MVSFHPESATPACLSALDILRRQAFLSDFYLAGGTALALQLGHRISTDLDWFSTTRLLQAAEREAIVRRLKAFVDTVVTSEEDGMLFLRVQGTDVSFLHQQHPLLESPVDFTGVQLASPVDIGVMKLAAVNSRGSRRDFVDLYCLRHVVSLDRLLELAATKYADRPSFLPIAARALAYFDDAEQQPMPRLLVAAPWPEVRAYAEGAARRLARRLSGLRYD